MILDNVQAWKALEESNRRIFSFAYKIGHDLKSPVSAVQSLLAAMQEGYAGEIPPKQQDILARCISKQEQLLMLIRDLLNLAEGQTPAGGQKLVPVLIDNAAAEAVKLFEAVSQEKNVALISLLPEQPVPFEAIPGDFQRLFSNLLDNAIRCTPPGGRVEVRVGCDDKHSTLSVKDTGIGIEPEYREKIFEEFFRTRRAKQCLADGTGLGLAIVKGIVNRYTGIVRDLAMRGFKTILVEKRGLTHGTTGRFHGLLHSGGRYVVKDPQAARECLQENMILRRIIPQCIEDTGGYFVTTPWDNHEYLPHFINGCRAVGIPVDEDSIKSMLRTEPLLHPKISTCFQLPDASADSFLAAQLNAQSAREYGADIYTYHEVEKLIRVQDRVLGVTCHDLVKDEIVTINADIVVNASGAWGSKIAQMIGITIPIAMGKD